MPFPILYQSPSKTITLVDIPLSIEHAQGYPSPGKLLSCKPPQKPYPSIEPKSAKAKANLPDVSVGELLLVRYLEIALEEVRSVFSGRAWCEARVIGEASGDRKRRRGEEDEVDEESEGNIPNEDAAQEDYVFFQNTESVPVGISINPQLTASIPPNSTVLRGEITHTLPMFKSLAPLFDLVILDPPWPNRSARRKGSYSTPWGNVEIRDLLASIPLGVHLKDAATVGVWVTNKPAFRDLLVGDGGVFDQWGVALVEEWIWVKVTEAGEPICDLDSTWRKPYEILLVARKRTVLLKEEEKEKEKRGVTRRVIISIPDIHSRKPNLKLLFEETMRKKYGAYEALEIFARNLTTGWWGWGDEALKFQSQDHWIHP